MSPAPVVWVQRLDPRAVLPAPMSAQAAGADLAACLPDGPQRLEPGARALIPTGLAIAVPDGFEGQIRPRSGLALAHGVTVLNAPGTIDADYRGPLGVLLINLGREAWTVEHGHRIAQLVIQPVAAPQFTERAELPGGTARGRGGFGSTGR